jgi:excisionase family DNA binding protein
VSESERLLRVAAVADRCDCSQDLVRILISSGQLKAVRLGERALRVRPADLEAFLAAR